MLQRYVETLLKLRNKPGIFGSLAGKKGTQLTGPSFVDLAIGPVPPAPPRRARLRSRAASAEAASGSATRCRGGSAHPLAREGLWATFSRGYAMLGLVSREQKGKLGEPQCWGSPNFLTPSHMCHGPSHLTHHQGEHVDLQWPPRLLTLLHHGHGSLRFPYHGRFKSLAVDDNPCQPQVRSCGYH